MASETLVARVRRTILRYNMLPSRGCRVGVAVSGGADSVFLLTALKQLVPHLTILHLNHGLRGAESESDEAFVIETAARVRLPFVVERAEGLAWSPNLEERAREARYEFFTRAAAVHKLNHIATGHTLDDQAETFLLRLLRGAGGTGLAGVQPVSREGLIVRPLIDVERCEIEAWLGERRIPWREDASNRDPAFARNRIRHGLLPQLERDWNPEIRRALTRTADVLAGEESYWREWTGSELAAASRPYKDGGLILELGPLRAMHPAALRRLLRAALEKVRGGLRRIDHGHIERLTRLCVSSGGSGAVRLPGGLMALRSFDRLLLDAVRAPAPFPDVQVCRSSRIPLPGGGTLHIQVNHPRADYGYNTGAGVARTPSIDPPVLVRGWRPGDAYQPEGCSRRWKLKELFHEHKVPSWERRSWPMIESEGRILWARRFGVAAGADLGWTCEYEMAP